MPSASKKKKTTTKATARKKDARPSKAAARKPAAPPAKAAKGGKTAARPVTAPPAKIAPGAASRNIPLPGKGGASVTVKSLAPGKGTAAAPVKGGAPVAAKGAPGAPGKPGLAPPGEQARPGGRPLPRAGGPKKGGRKSPLSQRRGPNGEPFVPGDLLLPTGPQGPDEVQYLLRGSVAAEHSAGSAGVSEIILKKGADAEGDRGELTRYAEGMAERF